MGDSGGGASNHHAPPRRIQQVDASGNVQMVSNPAMEIPKEIQEMRADKRLEALEKKIANPALTKNKRLFAAIRAMNKDRASELLQAGADANAGESPPWYIFAGTLVMPFILLCAVSSAKHYRVRALHVAMTQGDPAMVKLLLDHGADPKAPAVFWNCCVCCTWTAQSPSFQRQLMGIWENGFEKSATYELGDAVPPVQQQEMIRLINGA